MGSSRRAQLGMRRRRRRILELKHEVVHVAVVPVLARLERPDDRMRDGPEVPRRVLSRGAIAAADVPAFLADAQVNPVMPAGGEAVDAASAGRNDIENLIQMRTGVSHPSSSPADHGTEAVGGGAATCVSAGPQFMSFAAPSYVVRRNAMTARSGCGRVRTSS